MATRGSRVAIRVVPEEHELVTNDGFVCTVMDYCVPPLLVKVDENMGISYTTHVANATGEKIFARVGEDKIAVESLGAGVNRKVGVKGFKGEIDVHGDVKFHIGKLLHDGFVAIGSRDYLPFPANKEPYVSVITESGYMVSHNYRPGRDISVIVTADLTIKPTKYGHIWMDMDGKYH